MMGQMIGARSKVEPGGLDSRQYMVFDAAQVEDTIGADRWVAISTGGRGGREMSGRDFEIMIGADSFESLRERFAEVRTARDHTKAGLAGNEAARGACIDQLAGHANGCAEERGRERFVKAAKEQ